MQINNRHEECEVCNGKGEGYFSCCTGDLVDPDHAMCPVCKEHLGEEDCTECEGKGYLLKETAKVK